MPQLRVILCPFPRFPLGPLPIPPCHSVSPFPSTSPSGISIDIGPGLPRVGWAATLQRGPRRSQGELAGLMGSQPLPSRGAGSQSPSRCDPLHHAAARGHVGHTSRTVGRVGVGAPGHGGTAPIRSPPRSWHGLGIVSCLSSARAPTQRRSFWPICPPSRRQKNERRARKITRNQSNSSKSTRLRPPRTPWRPTLSLQG